MTDKQTSDADKAARQAEREQVAAKGKERAEQDESTAGTAQDAGFQENPRYGVKVSDDDNGR